MLDTRGLHHLLCLLPTGPFHHLPRLHRSRSNDLTSILVSLAFYHIPHEVAALRRIERAQSLELLPADAVEARGKEAGRDAKDFHAVVLEHTGPFTHDLRSGRLAKFIAFVLGLNKTTHHVEADL